MTDDDQQMSKVFVYGSLMKGHLNHHLLEDSIFIGEAVTQPEFTLLNLGSFPGLVWEGDTAVWGELYEIDEATRDRLDFLETHPRFYERTPIEVLDGDEELVAVEAYLLPADRWLGHGLPVVESGDWREQ